MDLVTQNLISSFRAQQTFTESLDDPTLFEHFANFCVVSKEYLDDFDVEDIRVAGGDDLQLDGVGIIVNGVLVDTIEEVDDLAQTNKYLDVSFIFVQAKMGSDFSGAEISNVFFGLRDLYSVAPKLPRNQSLRAKEEVIRHIYMNSALFKHGNPKIAVYYVTTGKWQDDPKLADRIENELSTLEELNIFRSPPLFVPIDARALQSLFNRAQNALTKTFAFSSKVTLPPIEGVREAYLGFLPALEYIKIITDDDGNLLRGLFYENVRDFQGDNPVNREIAETLQVGAKGAFVLLNNGITIVAEEMASTGDQFTLAGFQIVNGCQSSHVLFNNLGHITDQVFVSIKVVVAPQLDLRNQVIKATNRQTVVKTEELSALTDFQKSLEQYYSAIPEEQRLYYERRSQQYRATPGIEKIRVVTIPNQIRSFASMFLNRPHQASRYYGSLLKDIESSIFIEGHPPIAYFVSAFALFRLESMLRRHLVDNTYRPFKYHLLGIIRMLEIGKELPPFTSNNFEHLCRSLLEVLSDDEKCLALFSKACSVLDGILAGEFDRDRAKDSAIQSKAALLI